MAALYSASIVGLASPSPCDPQEWSAGAGQGSLARELGWVLESHGLVSSCRQDQTIVCPIFDYQNEPSSRCLNVLGPRVDPKLEIMNLLAKAERQTQHKRLIFTNSTTICRSHKCELYKDISVEFRTGVRNCDT